MVIPILKWIANIEEPDNIEDFFMILEACISEEGDEGEDFFSFQIMTPKRLKNILEQDKIFSDRSVFIVNEITMELNIELVKREINKMLKRCARETWEETALAINYFLKWEYYDPSIGICDYYLQTRNLKKQQFYIEKNEECN